MMSKITQNWRVAMAKVFVAAMVIMAVAFVPTYTAQAAKAPALSKKTVNLLIKNTYDLNVKNAIKGSTYKWESSNTKIATVDQSGLVSGKSRGDVVISCKVMTPDKKELTLSCKLKVVSGAKEFAISNKVAVLNKGQAYDLNRTLTPFTSNDVTTWTSSDTSIAKPDNKGKFKALKAGTVTITGKTLSGKSDSVTIKIIDADGTVANQAELEELLKLGAKKITIRTSLKANFTIPEGNYEKVTLVVDAPKADVYNNGVFKSIEILQISPNTFHENAKGNKLVIKSKEASIEVSPNASVAIEITSAGAKVTIKNENGDITGVVVMSAADLKIEGNSDKPIPVEIKAVGAKITTSVPMAVTATAPATLTLEKGAEKTTVAVDKKENLPAVKGSVTISVVVGTGATQEKVEVKGEEIKNDPAAPAGPPAGGGTPGGNNNPSTPVPDVTKVTLGDGRVQFTLRKPVSQLSTIEVKYSLFVYEVDTEMMTKLMGFLNDPAGSIEKWRTMGAVTRTYGAGSQVEIQASAATNGGTTRTIKFIKSPLGIIDGNEYTAVLGSTSGSNGSFTLTSLQSGKTFTVKKVNDYTLEFNTDIEGLEFTPVFK